MSPQPVKRLVWDPGLRAHVPESTARVMEEERARLDQELQRQEKQQKPDDQQLYHVGCGKPLFTRGDVRRGVLAMACRCGANSPIMVPDLEDPSPIPDVLPTSLIGAVLRHRTPPHLEYYLGFSDFTCPAKQAWEIRLRSSGSISFTECTQPGCHASWERSKARLEGKQEP